MEISLLEEHRKKIENLKGYREQLAEVAGSYGSTPMGAGSGVKTSAPTGNPGVEKAVDRKLYLEQRIAALELEIETEWRSWEPSFENALSPEELNIITFFYHRGKTLKWLVHRRQHKYGGEWKTCYGTVVKTRRRALNKIICV